MQRWEQGRVVQRKQEGQLEVKVSHSPVCQPGVQAGLASLFSESVELTQAQTGPNMGREEEVFLNQ